MTERQNREKTGGLSGAVLKNTAYVSMFIDHFFAVIFLNYMNLHPVNGGWAPTLLPIYRVGRAIGRIAFILFAFLIVEGFFVRKTECDFYCGFFCLRCCQKFLLIWRFRVRRLRGKVKMYIGHCLGAFCC